MSYCQQNFEGCPVNWTESEDGYCTPLPTYDGPCNKHFLGNATRTEKEAFAKHCKVQWPCDIDQTLIRKTIMVKPPATANGPVNPHDGTIIDYMSHTFFN